MHPNKMLFHSFDTRKMNIDDECFTGYANDEFVQEVIPNRSFSFCFNPNEFSTHLNAYKSQSTGVCCIFKQNLIISSIIF